MNRNVVFCLLVVMLSGCIEKDLFDPTGEEVLEQEDLKDFNLSDEINVKVDMPEGTRCLLFTSYPYVDGDLVEEPMMIAYAPVDHSVSIPKVVSHLYMYVNGDVLEFPRGDIYYAGSQTKAGEDGNPVMTRAEEKRGDVSRLTLSDAFVTAINKFYPEAVKNVDGEELKICTDLIAPEGIKSQWVDENGVTHIERYGKTHVWVTYVGDGGSGLAGDLECYTYQVDEHKNPVSTLAEVEASMFKIYERATPANYKGKRIYLGEFEPGTRIGFRYKGNTDYPKFTTPYYNKQKYSFLSYARYGGEVTCGVIRIWDYQGNSYATLGMENRIAGESNWDGDFNDMLCLLEADPLFVENVVEPPVLDTEQIRWGGYWLFEDNYPAKGDYDFNDLVVKYNITEYGKKEENKPTTVDLEFLARGASRANGFGINGKIYMEGLAGFENVYAGNTPVTPYIQQISVPRADRYIPVMNNTKTTFSLVTYNVDNLNYPCVLDIPIVNGSSFNWCLEAVCIDVAYPRYTDWVNSNCSQHEDWYLDVPVEGTVWQ